MTVTWNMQKNSDNFWNCHRCTESNFPFYNIENINEIINPEMNNLQMDQNTLDTLIYCPFAQNEDEEILDDIDPDSNFFNTQEYVNPHLCKYHPIENINKNINSTMKNKMSICHLNIRSLKKN
jgi:hypothetical protein